MSTNPIKYQNQQYVRLSFKNVQLPDPKHKVPTEDINLYGNVKWSVLVWCFCSLSTQSALHYTTYIPFTHIHTFPYTAEQIEAKEPTAHQTQKNTFIHIHNVGFRILPKDISTCRLEEPGIKPLTFRLRYFF